MKVSVIMANYRGAQHILAAIQSVLRQSHADLELIIADDASPDDSLSIIRAAMAGDTRVRLIESAVNAGPAATRNRALDVAQGDWIAIVDSDDLLHPQRLERLLAAARTLKADMVADDLVFFGDIAEAGGRTLLQPLGLRAPFTVTTARFLQASGEDTGAPPLGYLKLLIRRDLLDAARYDESLRIGEDYDLILRLLMAGGTFAVVADPMYLYRRHSASISHRLSEAAVTAMLAAHDRLAATAHPADKPLFARRRTGLLAVLQYERLLAAVRQHKAAQAAGMFIRQPGLARPLLRSITERLRRHDTAQDDAAPMVLHLGQNVPAADAGALSLSCPAVPEPGGTWASPPAPMAAALSRLSAQYRLSTVPTDAAGTWAEGLVP